MSFTPEQEAALRALENAAKTMRAAKSPKAEADYGAAYRKCVTLGVKPKIKRKYAA